MRGLRMVLSISIAEPADATYGGLALFERRKAAVLGAAGPTRIGRTPGIILRISGTCQTGQRADDSQGENCRLHFFAPASRADVTTIAPRSYGWRDKLFVMLP